MSQGLETPRHRFIPVNTDDLVLMDISYADGEIELHALNF